MAQRSCCERDAVCCRPGIGTRCVKCPSRRMRSGLSCCSRYPPTASRVRRTCARMQAELRLTSRTLSRRTQLVTTTTTLIQYTFLSGLLHGPHMLQHTLPKQHDEHARGNPRHRKRR